MRERFVFLGRYTMYFSLHNAGTVRSIIAPLSADRRNAGLVQYGMETLSYNNIMSYIILHRFWLF